MSTGEIVRALRNMLPDPVDYAELVGSPAPSSYGHHFVYEDPEPYIVEEAADLIESLQAQLAESQRCAEEKCNT